MTTANRVNASKIAKPNLDGLDPETKIKLELKLGEAEALREWLLRATVNGTSCLDEPLVNRVITSLGHTLDTMRAIASIRRELGEAGLNVAHLSDDQVRDLARRVSDAARSGLGT